MLDGSLLVNNTSTNAFPFILFLSGLALLLIFNTYYAESKARKTERLRRDMTELRIRYVQTKSEYMYMTKQSEIARTLKAQGFIEPDEPPVPVYGANNQRGFFSNLFHSGN